MSEEEKSEEQGQNEEKEEQKVALERLSSPDQLDKLMIVLSPKGWMSLIWLLVIVAAIIVWAFLGNIPIRVQGNGVILSELGPITVYSRVEGEIVDIVPKLGDTIYPGETIVTLYTPTLESQKKALASFQQTLQYQQAIIPVFIQDLEDKELLQKEGLLASTEVEQAKQALMGQQVSIEQTKMKIAQTVAEIQTSFQLHYLNREEAKLRLEMENPTDLAQTGPFSNLYFYDSYGKGSAQVVSRPMKARDQVKPGDAIFSYEYPIEPGDIPQIFVWVPGETGDQVYKGMRAEITLDSVDSTRWGRVIGRVTGVAKLPATEKDIQTIISGDAFSQWLLKTSPVLVQVTIQPDSNPNNPTGLEWTSGHGPDIPIDPGTLCNARITVEERKPIYYILPIWRDFTQSLSNYKLIKFKKGDQPTK